MRILILLGFYTVEVVRPSEFKRVKCVLFLSVTKQAVGTLYGGENRSKPCTFQVKKLRGTSEMKKQRTWSEKYDLHDKKTRCYDAIWKIKWFVQDANIKQTNVFDYSC